MCFPAVLDIAALMDLSIFKFHTHLTLPNTKQYVFVVAIIVSCVPQIPVSDKVRAN